MQQADLGSVRIMELAVAQGFEAFDFYRIRDFDTALPKALTIAVEVKV